MLALGGAEEFFGVPFGPLVLGVGDDFFEGRSDEVLVLAHGLGGDLDGRKLPEIAVVAERSLRSRGDGLTNSLFARVKPLCPCQPMPRQIQ